LFRHHWRRRCAVTPPERRFHHPDRRISASPYLHFPATHGTALSRMRYGAFADGRRSRRFHVQLVISSFGNHHPFLPDGANDFAVILHRGSGEPPAIVVWNAISRSRIDRRGCLIRPQLGIYLDSVDVIAPFRRKERFPPIIFPVSGHQNHFPCLTCQRSYGIQLMKKSRPDSLRGSSVFCKSL